MPALSSHNPKHKYVYPSNQPNHPELQKNLLVYRRSKTDVHHPNDVENEPFRPARRQRRRRRGPRGHRPSSGMLHRWRRWGRWMVLWDVRLASGLGVCVNGMRCSNGEALRGRGGGWGGGWEACVGAKCERAKPGDKHKGRHTCGHGAVSTGSSNGYGVVAIWYRVGDGSSRLAIASASGGCGCGWGGGGGGVGVFAREIEQGSGAEGGADNTEMRLLVHGSVGIDQCVPVGLDAAEQLVASDGFVAGGSVSMCEDSCLQSRTTRERSRSVDSGWGGGNVL